MDLDHDNPPPPAVSPRDASRSPAYLYRVHDTERRLIYIGSSGRLRARLTSHRLNSWWAYSVGRVRAELRPTIEDARRAERVAILVEKPRWNRREIRGQERFLPQEQFFDFVYGWAATLLHRGGVDRHHRFWLAEYQRVYQHRFGVPLGIGFDTLNLYANPVPTFETALGSPTPAPAPALSTGDPR